MKKPVFLILLTGLFLGLGRPARAMRVSNDRSYDHYLKGVLLEKEGKLPGARDE